MAVSVKGRFNLRFHISFSYQFEFNFFLPPTSPLNDRQMVSRKFGRWSFMHSEPALFGRHRGGQSLGGKLKNKNCQCNWFMNKWMNKSGAHLSLPTRFENLHSSNFVQDRLWNRQRRILRWVTFKAHLHIALSLIAGRFIAWHSQNAGKPS